MRHDTQTRKFGVVLSMSLMAGCAALEGPDPGNPAAYCTPENAYRLGSQSKAYFGTCPKQTESAFLAALQRGRALRPSTPQLYPYYQQMEDTERQLLAAGSDAERERLRLRLREVEWWTIHLLTSPGSYGEGH
jgi:Protein of unknown function (DUF2799)